jgi:hypothetical protein
MLTLKQLKEVLGHSVDQVSRKKDGSFIVRRGYFYRQGQDAQGFMLKVAAKLNEAKVEYEVVDYYDNWTSFNGGASLARSSHFGVVLKGKE